MQPFHDLLTKTGEPFNRWLLLRLEIDRSGLVTFHDIQLDAGMAVRMGMLPTANIFILRRTISAFVEAAGGRTLPGGTAFTGVRLRPRDEGSEFLW
jgi:hypothetical protein